jgi:hypothetical protein
MSGSKTKKNKEKKEKSNLKPLINPNALKNKFLKRIKEHKQRETQNISNDNSKEKEVQQFSDEFSDSINYLQTLSKQKKVNDEKTNYEKQKQHRKEVINRKTIKNYQQMNNQMLPTQLLPNQMLPTQMLPTQMLPTQMLPEVNIDLPEELRLEINPTMNNQMVLNKHVKDNVPYGILKGGLKPTYRDWSKTQRNNIVVNPNHALTIQSDKINKEKIERELRLQNLRDKLKNKKQEAQLKIQQPIIQQPSIQESSIQQPIIQQPIIQQPIIQQPIIQESSIQESSIQESSIQQPIIQQPLNEKIIATKKITKRTVKKKYTLGKSKIKKAVGVLIKDRRTRKHVITAQRDLKKKPINEIKLYLRDHNLIKVGSNAPNDVIRKLYESAMLSGEITNSNSENLLHNFSKEEKEL